MRKLMLAFFAVILVFTACNKEKAIQDQVDEFIQQYLYTVRDALEGTKGSIKDVYDNYLSTKMKEALTYEEFKDWMTEKYKGKIGSEIRTAKAALVVDKQTGDFIEATGQTSNVGRMANVMNQDESLIFIVRVVKENGVFKVELQDVMATIGEQKAEQERLNSLLREYKGLIKIDEIVGMKITDRPGMAQLVGTILNGSSDLDMVRVGIRVKFRDSNGDAIFATDFFPVVDMRFEGLRTSLLPNSVKVFKTVVKDIPDNWDPNQPLSFSFYLIDGKTITPEELIAENKERDKLKKLIEDTKKADEEARKQQKEIWEREKALMDKIKELQNQSK
ncbi:MAG TPA: hypothetical protein PKG52_09870 [bacterium]|nr:hypothetical protein [bacterium]HPS31028.1 hypothetical protein [bacterium]